jgi:hypothetical protein
MPWATVGDVATYTGVTATDAQVEQAQGVVEMFADVTEQSITLAPTNQRLLKQAVAYQAAWITQHPDWATSMDTSSVSQDQVSATFLHANAGILAPLAKRCIDRLSWKRNRGLRIRPRLGAGQIPRIMNVLNAAADDTDPRWQPIGSDGAPC